MKNNDKFDLATRGDRGDFDFFSPFFDDFFGMPMIDRREVNRFNQMMKTDVKEGDKDYTLEVELPGIDKKDVNLDLKDGYLTISAKREHHFTDDNKKANYIRRERSYGSFSRSFYVGNVKKEDVSASLDNGILKIVLPKEEKKIEGSNRIEIK